MNSRSGSLFISDDEDGPKHIPTMGFPSALLRLEAKVHPAEHCAALVKVLIKRYIMFFIATISFIWLQLRLFYPSFRERNKPGRGN